MFSLNLFMEKKKRITPVRWYGTTTGTGLGFSTVLRDYFDFFRTPPRQLSNCQMHVLLTGATRMRGYRANIYAL